MHDRREMEGEWRKERRKLCANYASQKVCGGEWIIGEEDGKGNCHCA